MDHRHARIRRMAAKRPATADAVVRVRWVEATEGQDEAILDLLVSLIDRADLASGG